MWVGEDLCGSTLVGSLFLRVHHVIVFQVVAREVTNVPFFILAFMLHHLLTTKTKYIKVSITSILLFGRYKGFLAFRNVTRYCPSP